MEPYSNEEYYYGYKITNPELDEIIAIGYVDFLLENFEELFNEDEI